MKITKCFTNVLNAIFLALCALSVPATSSCDLPELPTDLDLITSVEASNLNEVHLHGMYKIGLDPFQPGERAQVHNLSLRYSKLQEFRVSIQPHDAVELDLILINTEKSDIVSSSMNGGKAIERMVFAVLTPEVSYTLMIKYSMAWSWGINCPQVMVELATQPKEQAQQFTDVCEMVAPPSIPIIRPTLAENFYFEFISDQKKPSWIDIGGNKQLQDELTEISRYAAMSPPSRKRLCIATRSFHCW